MRIWNTWQMCIRDSEIARKGTYSVGDLTIDYNKHQVLVNGENAKLTLSEFRIVALLGKYAGKVLTYDFIIKELWGPRAGDDNQILRVNMANIRRKVEKNPAEPEYLFTEAVSYTHLKQGVQLFHIASKKICTRIHIFIDLTMCKRMLYAFLPGGRRIEFRPV